MHVDSCCVAAEFSGSVGAEHPRMADRVLAVEDDDGAVNPIGLVGAHWG